MHEEDSYLSRLFRWYGSFAARYPALLIFFSAAIASIIGSGILIAGLVIDTDPQRIWVPPASTTALQQNYFDDAFDPFFRVNQVIITLDTYDAGDGVSSVTAAAAEALFVTSTSSSSSSSSLLSQLSSFSSLTSSSIINQYEAASTAAAAAADDDDSSGGNNNNNTRPPASVAGILTKEYFLAVYQLQQAITSTAASDGTILDNVCYKPIAGEGCLIETPLDFFRSNLSTIEQLTPALIQDALACRHILGQTTIPCMSVIGVPVLPQVVLGGTGSPSSQIPGYNGSTCGGNGTAAQALILTFLLQNTAETADAAATWEHDVFLRLVEGFSAPGLRATYMAERSISDALAIVDSQNQYIVVVSYAVMFVYISLALGKFPHPIATRALLGFQGMLIVSFSVICALGIFAWFGFHITMVVNEVVPFLILAIGVDNMFIIAKNIDRRWWGPLGKDAAIAGARGTDGSGGATTTLNGRITAAIYAGTNIQDAAAETMAEVGPTISAAAACEVLAFGMGITTMIPALQQFCAVAAMAVAFDYVLQLTWFLPAVVLDARRQEARRADIFPCIRIRGGTNSEDVVPYTHCSCGVRQCLRAREENQRRGSGGRRFSGGSVDSRDSALLSADGDASSQGGASAGSNSTAGGQPGGGNNNSLTGRFHRPTRDLGLEQGFAAGYAAAASRWGDVGRPTVRASSSNNDHHTKNHDDETTSGVLFTSGSSGSLNAVSHNSQQSGATNRGASTSLVGSPAFYAAYGGGQGRGGAGGAMMMGDDDDDDAAAAAAHKNAKNLPIGGPEAAHGVSFDYDDDFDSSANLEDGGGIFSFAIGGSEGRNSFKAASYAPRFWFSMNKGGFVRSCMNRFYAPVLFHPLARIIVVLVWLSMLGISFYGISQFKLGLEQQLALPENSYLKPYFDYQARLGEAGPPAYLVLQGVNYTHPNASSSIASLATAIGGLTDYIVAPVYSWVSDFEIWGSDENRAYVAKHPELQCPPPLDPANATHAARVAQYVYQIPIPSPCCQAAGYCGGQYSSDVKFLWGIPKSLTSVSSSSSSAAAAAAVGDGSGGVRLLKAVNGNGALLLESASIAEDGFVTAAVTKEGFSSVQPRQRQGLLHRSVTRVSHMSSSSSGSENTNQLDVIDDGGCDISLGYVSHRHVENAMKKSTNGASKKLGSRVTVPGHVVAGSMPSSFVQRLSTRFSLSSSSSSYSSSHDQQKIPFEDLPVTLIPCHVMTTRLRTQHTPLRNQSDFIDSMEHTQQAVLQLQSSLPTIDLAVYGLTGYGGEETGDLLNSSSYGYISDNEHTAWLTPTADGAAFPYSLVYVYYDQYSYIRGVVVTLLCVSIAAVLMASFFVTSPGVAIMTAALVTSMSISLCGWVWLLNPHDVPDPFGGGPYGVDINAVSVVNLVAAVGLGVEFIIHMAAAFARTAPMNSGKETEGEGGGSNSFCCGARDTPRGRLARARHALVHTGSAVVTGITITKLVGVTILGWAPSQLFRLYYFRMYLGIIVLGAFHGLALLPVLMATFGCGM